MQSTNELMILRKEMGEKGTTSLGDTVPSTQVIEYTVPSTQVT